MIEIFNIIFLVFSIFWISTFPLFKNNLLIYKFSILENISINLAILLNVFLFFSFYKLNQQYIFLILMILPLLNLFFLKKEIIKENIILLLFFSFILSIAISSNLYLEWDAQALWIYKVINFLDGNNFNNLSNVPGEITYPHLGTYVWAFFWKNSFIDLEYTGRVFYMFIYSLSILIIVDLQKKDLLKKILIISGIFILSLDSFLLSGYQEYLVFSIFIFIFYFYFRFNKTKEKIFIVPIILFINSILWIKNEASFFVLFFLFFAFFHHLIKKEKINKELVLLSILYLFFVFIKNIIFHSNFGEVNMGWQDYTTNNFGNIFQFSYFIERTSSIFVSILVALIKCKIYLVFFLVLFFNLNKKNFKVFLPYIFFLLLNITLIYLIYYLANDPNWANYLATTVDRLLFQTSGIYLLPILFILKKNNYL